jgi:hypothetical protein
MQKIVIVWMPITNTSTISLTVSSKRNVENGERRQMNTK